MKIKKEKISYYFIYYFKVFLLIFILTIFALGYFLIISPQLKKIFHPDLNLKILEENLISRQKFLEKLNLLEAEWGAISSKDLEKINLTLPSTEKKLDYLALLDFFIKKNNFSYTSLNFSPSSKKIKEESNILETIFDLNDGNYLSFKKFLTDLEITQRLTDIISLSFSPSSGSFNFKIKTYFLESPFVKEKITWQTKLPDLKSIKELIISPKFLDLKETSILIEAPPLEEVGRSNPFIPF